MEEVKNQAKSKEWRDDEDPSPWRTKHGLESSKGSKE